MEGCSSRVCCMSRASGPAVGGCAGLRGGRGAVAAVGGGCGLILMLGHSLSGVVECQGPDSCMSAKCDSVLPLTEQARSEAGVSLLRLFSRDSSCVTLCLRPDPPEALGWPAGLPPSRGPRASPSRWVSLPGASRTEQGVQGGVCGLCRAPTLCSCLPGPCEDGGAAGPVPGGVL